MKAQAPSFPPSIIPPEYPIPSHPILDIPLPTLHTSPIAPTAHPRSHPMPTPWITVSPFEISHSGRATLLMIEDHGEDWTNRVVIPVEMIDSLVSALYNLRCGQVTESEEITLRAKIS